MAHNLNQKNQKSKFDNLHNIMYIKCMEREQPLEAAFYMTRQGNQPCRDFLLELTRDDRREVGSNIFAVQKGFPIGLPLCRKMDS